MPRKFKNDLPPLNLGKEPIGQRIARIRKEMGLTQEVLGQRIGISQTLVSDYETGRVRLFDEMVARFALALRVSTDELLGLKNCNHPIGPKLSLRIIRRIKQVEDLPEARKKAILRTLDDLIRANS